MALTAAQKDALAKTLPDGKLFFDFADRLDYTRDATELTFLPDALFFAESEADVVSAVKLCRDLDLPLVARGAGTGYSGGALAVRGGLLLSIEHLRAIRIDADRRLAVTGPGAITGDIMKAAEAVGLFYPPDPASFEESTISGNLAENAGGLRCKKYGVTKDYVIGFRGVLPSADIITVNQYSPFGLLDQFVGSEGTLLIFTEISLRLIDLPQPGKTVQATFDKAVDAASVVAEVTASGIVPCIMEFMDRDAIDCANQYDPDHSIQGGAAMLLFETDGPAAAAEAEKIMVICRKHSPRMLRLAADTGQRELLWKTRRNLSHAVKQAVRTKMAEDVCVPPSRLPELVAFVEQLANDYSIRVNCYGHAGDGNLHVNFLGISDSDREKREIADGVVRLFEKTLRLNGTLSGEHGIGITKKDYLSLEFSPATLQFMKRLRTCVDPSGIYNPGKIF